MFKELQNQSRMTFGEAEKKFPNNVICLIDIQNMITGIPVAVSENKSSLHELCAFSDKMCAVTSVAIVGDYDEDSRFIS